MDKFLTREDVAKSLRDIARFTESCTPTSYLDRLKVLVARLEAQSVTEVFGDSTTWTITSRGD